MAWSENCNARLEFLLWVSSSDLPSSSFDLSCHETDFLCPSCTAVPENLVPPPYDWSVYLRTFSRSASHFFVLPNLFRLFAYFIISGTVLKPWFLWFSFVSVPGQRMVGCKKFAFAQMDSSALEVDEGLGYTE